MYFALFSLFAILAASQPADPPSTGGNATRLVQLVNNFIISQGGSAIPISKALMHVGQRHADIISANPGVVNGTCNEFSWPSAPQGAPYSWVACCFNGTNPQASLECMTQKAAQITNGWTNPYTSPSIETTAYLNGTFQDYEAQFVSLWINQTQIVSLIMANGTYSVAGPWGAIGAGITLNGTIRRAYLVFGKAPDTNGNSPTPTPTLTPTPPITPTPTNTPTPNPSNNTDPILPSGGNPETLVALINDYRVSQQKNACNISRALMYTAQYHASAIARDQSAINNSCNIFSWPAPLTADLWEACCYTLDNNNYQCMSQKPTQITRNWTIPYTSETNAETSVSLDGTFADPETSFLDTLINNPGTRDFILGNGTNGKNWTTIGAGIANYSGRTIAYLWFSEDADQNTWQGFPNGTTPTPTPTNTPTPTDSGVPTPTGTPTPVPMGSPTPTLNPNPTPTGTPSPTPTLNPNPTPTNTPIPTPDTVPSQTPTSDGIINSQSLFMLAINLVIVIVLFI